MKNTKEELQWLSLFSAKDLSFVEKMIERNIDVNIVDKHGDSLLILACNKGNLPLVKLLLKQPGINVNLQDNTKQTALMKAVYMRHKGIIKLLLNHPDIDINLRNNWDDDSLFIACERNNPIKIFKLLLNRPEINVNYNKEQGSHKSYNILLFAAVYGKKDYIRLLLMRNDVNIKSLTSSNKNFIDILIDNKKDLSFLKDYELQKYFAENNEENLIFLDKYNLVHDRIKEEYSSLFVANEWGLIV